MSIIIEFHNLNKSEIIEKNQKQTRAFYIVDKGKKMLQINTIPDSQMSVPIDQIKSFSQTILFDEFGMRKMSDLIDSIIDTSVSSKPKEAINDSFPLQQIFYGAPGTGKSHKVKEVTDTLPKSDVFRTTFHPDSDYSTFVGCYKPKMVKAPIRDSSGHEITSACEDEKKRIAYEYEPQAFLKAYVRAYETNEPVFLVIEEINRGNCVQIFGDMFQLLDRNENGESDYAIKPETAIQEFLNEKLEDCDIADEVIKSGEEMRLPTNLHIWATMNTSDQSLFPIDSAFKRRWDWKYMPIKRADKEPENKWIIKVTHDGKTYWCYWWEFLEAINHQIEETTHSEDKQLGYFFAKPKNGEDFISTDTFVNKVIFYLWNDVFKDEDSAVFQYDNNKVEDVSVNHSGTMYFRHFMANTDEMIHYFINQLFVMGKDNNPVVPIDYLKYDNGEGTEHLLKMREDAEEAPEAKEISEENADDADGKTKRNTDKYIVDGAAEKIPKTELLAKIVEKQIKQNPDITIEELKECWNVIPLNARPSILDNEEYQELISNKTSYEGRYNQIEGRGIWVNNQIGGAENASEIIKKAQSLGIKVEIVGK